MHTWQETPGIRGVSWLATQNIQNAVGLEITEATLAKSLCCLHVIDCVENPVPVPMPDIVACHRQALAVAEKPLRVECLGNFAVPVVPFRNHPACCCLTDRGEMLHDVRVEGEKDALVNDGIQRLQDSINHGHNAETGCALFLDFDKGRGIRILLQQ